MKHRLRLPRPGIAEGGHGPGPGRRPSRRAAPSSTRPTARWASPCRSSASRGRRRTCSSPPTPSPRSSPRSVAALRALARAGRAPDLRRRPQPGRVLRARGRGLASTLADAVATVRRRGQYMQEAVPVGEGAMAAILGLDLAGGRERPAARPPRARSSPPRTQLPGAGRDRRPRGRGGPRHRRSARPRERSGRLKLPVSAPFHCALMKPAQERLARGPRRAHVPRSRGAPREQRGRARRAPAAAECRDGLVRQVSGAVRWQESVERLVRAGRRHRSSRSGPGTVLGGLVKKIAKDVRC